MLMICQDLNAEHKLYVSYSLSLQLNFHKWYMGLIVSEHLSFPLPLPFHHCSILNLSRAGTVDPTFDIRLNCQCIILWVR